MKILKIRIEVLKFLKPKTRFWLLDFSFSGFWISRFLKSQKPKSGLWLFHFQDFHFGSWLFDQKRKSENFEQSIFHFSISKIKLRFTILRLDVKHFYVMSSLWIQMLPLNLKKYWPLWLLSLFGKDIWYATKILGWTLEYDFGSKKIYHFHTPENAVIRPSDYNRRLKLLCT